MNVINKVLGNDNKFDPAKDIPTLTGKTAIVTGGSQGIGLGISAHLLAHNPEKLIILSSSKQHFDEAKEFLKDYGDTSKIEWANCDMANLTEVNNVAKSLKSSCGVLDALVLNAGIGVGAYEESSADHIDTHFQINVLSHYILARTLLGNLQKAAEQKGDARLVWMSSSLHAAAPGDVKFSSLTEINKDIGPMRLYGRTKLGDLLLARAFNRKYLSNTNVFCNATHPGAVSTGQQSQMETEDAYGRFGTMMVAALRPLFKDAVTDGCRSALFATTSPDIKTEHIRGAYIVPDRKVEEPSKQAQDDALGDNLWGLCDSILREKGIKTDF